MHLGVPKRHPQSTESMSSTPFAPPRSSARTSTGLLRAHLWRLPVPDIQRTLERYLQSLEPFLLEDEANGGDAFEDAHEQRKEWCQALTEGVGKVLQQRLRGSHLALNMPLVLVDLTSIPSP